MLHKDHLTDIVNNATCLYNEAEVEEALEKMAKAISEDLADKNPVFLCVVIGGIITMGRLLPKIEFPLQLDYIHVSRYGDKADGSNLDWKAKPSCDLNGRNVVIVDDVLDGGMTLRAIKQFCEEANCNEVYTAVLADKPSGRHPNGVQKPDYSGLTLGDHWVIGSGMDYKGYLRNLNGIYALSPETIKKVYSS
ncbi:MAG: hypoxanthine-guanine phosphoribosyltransferase [Legionellales bacterium]|nr:hypoxanthine-guanine phosphoribosyltransferase [Legionellales bacterium]